MKMYKKILLLIFGLAFVIHCKFTYKYYGYYRFVQTSDQFELLTQSDIDASKSFTVDLVKIEDNGDELIEGKKVTLRGDKAKKFALSWGKIKKSPELNVSFFEPTCRIVFHSGTDTEVIQAVCLTSSQYSFKLLGEGYWGKICTLDGINGEDGKYITSVIKTELLK